MPETVLVTGGSGFLGLHTILQLLERGHRVRTTVRSPAREAQVREIAGDRVAVFTADLLADDGWAAATAGADFVLHVASPFPGVAPDHEDDLIIPAREGTLRVLRAARDAGVRRTVVTSSFAAVGYGRSELGDHVFTEEDWTDPAADVGAYIKSKAIAERAAWDFARGDMELSVVNPVGIFGPVLGPDHSASIGLISALLGGAMAGGMPRLAFSVIDVRDAADLHLRAMTDPAAAGERFIGAAGDGVWLADVARILREQLGDAAAQVPTTELPDDIVRANAPASDPMAREVGNFRHLSAEKARRVLGWEPRSTEEAILATAESLLGLGATA
ncbi:MAG TPA: aldehyde reductase [Solirubrobacter sp.]